MSNTIKILKMHGKETQTVQNIMEFCEGKYFSGCLIHPSPFFTIWEVAALKVFFSIHCYIHNVAVIQCSVLTMLYF